MLWRELKFVALFTVCGFIGLGANLVRSPAFSKDPSRDFLVFSSYGSLIFTSPSIFFALAILLAGFLAATLHLVPRGSQFSMARILLATVIAVLAFPAALAGMIVAGLSIYGPLGSDNPSSAARWRLVLFDNAGEIAVVFGGVLTVCILAVAFRIVTKRWPLRLWVGILGIALGVPLFTALIESVMGVPKPELFLEPRILGIPLLLVIGEPILAGLIGHWFFVAAKVSERATA
jgi:hypothetical protein